jgi:chromosomal replication initiator protein
MRAEGEKTEVTTDERDVVSAMRESLAGKVGKQKFELWFADAAFVLGTGKFIVEAPNEFKKEVLRANFAVELRAAAAAFGDGAVVEFRVNPELAPPPRAPADAASSGGGRNVASPASAPRPAHRPIRRFADFASFVVGASNQLAFSASQTAAELSGDVGCASLLLYGTTGVGKTHLVESIWSAAKRGSAQRRIAYLTAEQFTTQFVDAVRGSGLPNFRNKVRGADLLIIDDVQFFAGKERTQEEFFNAFEALLAKRAHIIMTSDTYPKGLADIDERLTSRFDAGLTVAIEPPELEMRVAILIKKAVAEGAAMPEDVAFFVAKNVRANVRELEGALRKVLAYARFSQKEISIGLAREALKDLLSIQNRQVGVENIQKTVADFYKIKIADMYSKKRPASIARPRQIAMYLAKEMTQKSLPEIGELFGGRDHTTVLHAVRKIGGERSKNTELNQQLHVLEQTLKG